MLKNVDFLVDNNVFRNSQIAPDCTIFITKNAEEYASGHP